ncbi:WPP domain-associated protein isoform X1 [Triticum aestivum]|uniref:WPP domain-associated protein isoform X1 n=1 Tax=Triticum aestivum TaxID=4565 RepID=UPI001D0323D2|nr:WPP domain-associated protein-like isoform X1 [Triticum aestivum]
MVVMSHTGKDKVMVSFLQERTQRNLGPQIPSDSILLRLLGMVILLMEGLLVFVCAVLFIMILKLEKKILQRRVSAVTSCVTQNWVTKFRSQVFDQGMDPFLARLTIPAANTSQSRCTPHNGLSLLNRPSLDTPSSLQGSPVPPPPSLFSCNCSCDIGSNFEAFATVMSRLHQHLLDADVEINYTEYLDLMKLEVDQQLNRLKEDMMLLKSHNFVHDSDADVSCPAICRHGKPIVEIDEGFNDLKLLLIVVFRQIKDMLSLFNASIHDLQWEHDLQLEVTGIMIGDCIRTLEDELERRFFEQSSIVNNLRENRKETVVQCGAIRQELMSISDMLLPSEDESHSPHSKHENLGNRSNRWKYNLLRKKTGEEHSASSSVETKKSATQRSVSPREVISEKSDFRHLRGSTGEEIINYFRSEISKLKRLHELYLQDKTEELFKFKREKASLDLKHDLEFEHLRKKVPDIISRVDTIISSTIKAPTVCSTSEALEENCRLNNKIDSLYLENQHLSGLLAEKMNDIKGLSCQISDARREISLRLSLEEQIMRQVDTIKGDYDDLYVESTIRDEVYRTVTRNFVDDCRTSMEDASRNSQAEVSSLEAKLSEREKALCLANEENQKLTEKLLLLEKEHFIENDHENPELTKQESDEMTLRDIEMEPHVSARSYESCEQSMEDKELVKPSPTIEIASTTLQEVETKKLEYNGFLGKNEHIIQLDFIMVSIMDLSKEFVEIEHKISGDIEGNERRSDDLRDQCNHVVQQAIVLTKKGLSYKQMLDRTRSELRKAEAEVDILENKVTALLSIAQKIYATLEHYSPVFQQYPGLLGAFLKTCKLVAGLRNKQRDDLQDTT